MHDPGYEMQPKSKGQKVEKSFAAQIDYGDDRENYSDNLRDVGCGIEKSRKVEELVFELLDLWTFRLLDFSALRLCDPRCILDFLYCPRTIT